MVSFGAAMWRSRIPVRVTIHSSEVSTILSKSAFVRTVFGQIAASTNNLRIHVRSVTFRLYTVTCKLRVRWQRPATAEFRFCHRPAAQNQLGIQIPGERQFAEELVAAPPALPVQRPQKLADWLHHDFLSPCRATVTDRRRYTGRG